MMHLAYLDNHIPEVGPFPSISRLVGLLNITSPIAALLR